MPTEAVVAGFADVEDPSVLAKQLKKELKEFERAFQQREGRKPDKADIAQNKDISRKYKQYSKLKSQLGNDAGDEETATRKSSATPVSKSNEPPATTAAPALPSKSSSDSLPRKSKSGSADRKKSKRASESRQGDDSDVAPPPVPRKQSDATKQKAPLAKRESLTETELEPVAPSEYVRSGPLRRTSVDGNSSASASPVAWNHTEELPANFRLPKNQSDGDQAPAVSTQRPKLAKDISVASVESTDLNHLLKETVADMESAERSPGSAFSNFLARKNQIESLSSSRPETPVSPSVQSPMTPTSESAKPTFIDASAARVIEVAGKSKEAEPPVEEIPVVVEAPTEDAADVEKSPARTSPSAEKDEVERPMTSASSDASDDAKGRPSSGTTFGSNSEPPPLPPKTGIEESDQDDDKENGSGAVMPVTDNNKGELSVGRPRSVSRQSQNVSDRDLVPLLQPKLFSRVPKGQILKCKVYRKKSMLDKTHPIFFVYNESDDNFLMAARKRMMTKAVSFVISNHADELSKDSQYYIGKLSANSQRTQFILSDARQYNKLAAGKGLKQLLCVQYSKTVLPREMQAAIPATSIGEESDEISKDIVEDMRIRNIEKLMLLRNKPPRWNEATQTHCLNFGGRVTMPSIKNFQLVGEQDENYITMQFGRCGENEFTMDVKWPMTPIQAFSIALTTFDAYDSA